MLESREQGHWPLPLAKIWTFPPGKTYKPPHKARVLEAVLPELLGVHREDPCSSSASASAALEAGFEEAAERSSRKAERRREGCMSGCRGSTACGEQALSPGWEKSTAVLEGASSVSWVLPHS